ncbi:MAG TPA: hypothetical protein VFX59_13210 [Polyangiales bacterium]|nr:hypothetical protein [Polyangiales bacterium]
MQTILKILLVLAFGVSGCVATLDDEPHTEAPYDDEQIAIGSAQQELAASSFHGWSSIGSSGLSNDPPAVVTRGTNIDLYARGLDNQLHYNYWSTRTGWLGWSALGGVFTSKPAATAMGTAGIAVAGRGLDSRIYINVRLSKTTSTGSPQAGTWDAIPGLEFNSAPAVAYYGQKLWVFAISTDGQLWVSQNAVTVSSAGLITYDKLNWTAWAVIPGQTFNSDPAAVATGGRLLVVGRPLDRKFWQSTSTGSTWTSWSQIPSGNTTFTSAPALSTDAPYGQAHVFGREASGGYRVASNSGSSWSSFSLISSIAGGTAPSVVALGPSDIYLFTTQASEQIYWNHGY